MESLIPNVYSDKRTLTEKERQKMSEMIHYSFIEIRLLGWRGKSEQAAALADVFHNIPNMMWGKDFSLDMFRDCIVNFQQDYTESETVDFLILFDRLFR